MELSVGWVRQVEWVQLIGDGDGGWLGIEVAKGLRQPAVGASGGHGGGHDGGVQLL